MSPITFCLVTQVLSITLATPLPASLTCPIQTGPAATPQHGIWIATPEHNHFFDSPAEMRRRLLAMRQRGINTVFISMWNQGSTLYPSAVMQALTGMPSTAGYNPCTVALYAAEHGGKTPPLEAKNAEWLAWRAAKLNAFMQRLHGAWKAARPGLQISMSPSPFPWGYEAELRKISHDQVCPAQLGRVFPGLLLSLGREYRASPELLRGMVAANRHAGVLGEVFFHSEGLEQLPLRP